MTTLQELWAESSVLWLETLKFQVFNPAVGSTRFTPFPYQVRFLEDRSRFRVVEKARQVGLSQAIALEALHKAVFRPGSLIVFISRTEDLAKELLNSVKNLRNSLSDPDQWAGELVQDTTGLLRFRNGSSIRSEAATPKAGRGYPMTDLYMDEAAFMTDAATIYTAAVPAIGLGGRLTIISTPNGKSDEGEQFYLIAQTDMGSSFSKHRIYWFDNPFYNPEGYDLPTEAERREVGMRGAWYALLRPTVSHETWAQEYELSFDVRGATVFVPSSIEALPDGWLGDQPYIAGRTYLKSMDVGRRNDPTVIGVWDTTDFPNAPAQHVYTFEQEGLPYPQIAQAAKEIHMQYPGPLYLETNASGDYLYDFLTIPPSEGGLGLQGIFGYWMNQGNKKLALDALKMLLDKRLLKSGNKKLADQLKAYKEQDKKIVQDYVMMAAIAARHLLTGAVTTGGWDFVSQADIQRRAEGRPAVETPPQRVGMTRHSLALNPPTDPRIGLARLLARRRFPHA